MVMTGPLAPWAAGMEQRLTALGYTRRMVRVHLQLAGGLSRFMQQHDATAVDEMSPQLIEQFLDARRARSRWRSPTPRLLSWLVDFLAEAGAVTLEAASEACSARQALLERYRGYLAVERGLEPCTVANYVRAVQLFLQTLEGRELDQLTAGDIAGFMSTQVRQAGGRQTERLATALRSFLGFALVEGLIGAPLAGAVPSVARWSGASLPRGLTGAQVTALLHSCDLRTAKGRRDYAILVLLSRLGLRAAEAAGLRLDDIDWRAGQVTVRGKGRTEEVLPLPADVGAALASYLQRGRPTGRPEREVFLRCNAPLHGLAPQGISEVVRAASERAGVGSFGAHRLRHIVSV